MTPEIAVLGLGTMGGRAAARAAYEGVSVVGYDPNDEARRRAQQNGVHVVETAQEAATAAPTILTSVPGPAELAALADTSLLVAAARSVVVDLSTIDPDTARRAADTLAEREVTYLDAPVLGRPDRCGDWTLVVGGPEAAVESVQPLLLRTVAGRVARVGDVGAGSVVKLLNNLMFGAINSVTAEVLALCRASGVNPADLVDAVAGSGAATVSNLFRELAPRMIDGDYDPTFALALLAKDNRLALRLADESGVAAPVAQVVNRINTAALGQGLGDRDTGAVHLVYTAPPSTPAT